MRQTQNSENEHFCDRQVGALWRPVTGSQSRMWGPHLSKRTQKRQPPEKYISATGRGPEYHFSVIHSTDDKIAAIIGDTSRKGLRERSSAI